MCYTSDNHDYMCHTGAKEFLNSSFNWAVIDKISDFHDFAPNFTISQISKFFKYFCNFLDQLLHPYKFHGRDMSGILFFIFASCHPLMHVKLKVRAKSFAVKYHTCTVLSALKYNIVAATQVISIATESLTFFNPYQGEAAYDPAQKQPKSYHLGPGDGF